MQHSKGCKRHYFSVESILASEEQIPCTFLRDQDYIGFLEPGNNTSKVSAGSTLQLPYWIASCFAPYTRAVNVGLPKPYKKAFRDVLKADATVVDLKSLSRHYYILGEHLAKLNQRESPEIRSILIQTFRKRFRKIMDWSLNGSCDQTKKLDWSELNLFESAKKSQDFFDSWLKEDNNVIKASAMITSHKKRKMTNIEFI